jgi:tellurite resistance protein TerC
VVVILAIDLGLLNRKAHVVSIREALAFTMALLVLALGFAGLLHFVYERQWFGLGQHLDGIDGVYNTGRLAAVKFLTGYVIEVSLSADNVFVMAIIFQYLRVPAQYQHRVLFWGILGALVMRGVMIVIGAALIARYHWILYVFGVFLLVTGIKMLLAKEESEADLADSIAIRLMRRFFPVTPTYHDERFSIIQGGKRVLTPLAVALVMVETTDLVFAVDSIPAIFAITTDPFIVFTSNVFAILGLRSLYFALAGAIEKFHYLKVSLAAILMLVGVKMLVADLLKRYIGPSFNYYLLGAVALILLAGVVASLKYPKQADAEGVPTD